MSDLNELNIPQGKPLELELGESWRNKEKRIITIKYDFKPASIDLSNATLHHGADGSVVIKVPDSDGSDNMTTVYTGHSYDPKAGVLDYDEETGKVTLERINYAYRVKYTRPHNLTTGSDVPNSGERKKVAQEVVKRPSSSMSSVARQPTAAAAFASASASRAAGTPPSTSRGARQDGPRSGTGVPPLPLEDSSRPPQVYFMPDEESDEEHNIVSSTTGSSGSDSGSDTSDSGSAHEDEPEKEEEEEEGEEEGEDVVSSNRTNNSAGSKHDDSLPRLSPDCSSRSSSKQQNTSTSKPQLSSSGSESDIEVNFDDVGPPSNHHHQEGNSSNSPPSIYHHHQFHQRNNSNSSRSSAHNGGHFSSLPKNRFIANLSDSDSDD